MDRQQVYDPKAISTQLSSPTCGPHFSKSFSSSNASLAQEGRDGEDNNDDSNNG
jgi:hypothetical protein